MDTLELFKEQLNNIVTPLFSISVKKQEIIFGSFTLFYTVLSIIKLNI